MDESSPRLGDPEGAVRAALARHPVVRGLAGGPLTVLHGGLGNHAWRTESEGRSYFVRLGADDAAELGVDRSHECTLLDVVAAAGFAPVMIACDAELGLIVTEFVDGKPWTAQDAGRESNLRRIGDLLRRLHALPAADRLQQVSFSRQAERLAAAAVAEAEEQSLRDRARIVFARLAPCTQRLAVCHNDVHHLNVIDTGSRLWLVDWEYGGQGDPLFDLAGFLCQHDLDERQRATFLDAYGARGADTVAALADACWAFDYVQWLWFRLWLRRHADPDGSHARHAGRLAQRLLRCNNELFDAGRG